jgi:tRNA uracil 4-sulfurtransferase
MILKVMVRYGEIALKGKNRNQFEQQLHQNLKAAVREHNASISRLHGRFIVTGPAEYKDQILKQLSRVFGVVSVSEVWETDLDLEMIKNKSAEIVNLVPPGSQTFKIVTRRANKKFPYPSPEMNRLLGSHLQQLFPSLIVNLKQPSFKIYLEIGFDKAYLYLDSLSGPGGLPVGITGRSLLLLSGGIDSPTAGWLAMKRGLTVEALHFHSFPFTGRRSQEKAVELCRKLAQYSGKIPLHIVSVTNIQKEFKANCPDELAIILLRRMMLRLAEIVSEKRNLKALVTGENLGQVASQTLESITVIAKAIEMLVLRPLVGMDKRDIIELAKRIDTYDISIQPYEDCCTLFMPRKPVTKPKIEIIEKFEAGLDIETMLEEAISSIETVIVKR